MVLTSLVTAVVLAACSASIDVDATPVPSSPTPTTAPATAPTTTAPATTAPAPATSIAPPEPTATTPATTAPGSPVVLHAGPGRNPQPYDEALSAAILDIQAYWTATFPSVYGSPYRPVAGGIWPVYPGATGVPGCGTSRTRYRDIAGNAFYCPDSDFFAFDDQDLFPSLYDQYGVEVLDMIMAHEWGHAIQARAGISGDSAIELEQQADCFSGAWLSHEATAGGPVTVNDETLNVAMAGMVSFSDAPGTTAGDEGAHGSGFDRVGAFQDGYTGGAQQCAAYPTNPPPVIELPLTTADITSNGNISYDEIVPSTVKDLDRFWAAIFTSRGATYAAPAGGLKPYSSGGPYPACAGVPNDKNFFVGRVWYCPQGDFIAYDQDVLKGRVYDIGDFAVSVLLGTAWADAMQSRLGEQTSGKDRSLEGDCLTGAWTRSTLPDVGAADRTLTLSAGDLDEGIIAFLRFGTGQQGASSAQVGTAFDRVASFRRGILQGVDACGLR